MNKKLNIIPQHDENRTCEEDIVVSFAMWKKIDFELMYGVLWKFHLLPKELNEVNDSFYCIDSNPLINEASIFTNHLVNGSKIYFTFEIVGEDKSNEKYSIERREKYLWLKLLFRI